MNSKRWITVGNRVCLLIAAGAVAGAAPARAEMNGTLQVVKGDVRIQSASTGRTESAKVGQKVFAKDTVITAKDSRVKIVMADQNEINVSPDSKLVIQRYEASPEQNKKNVLLNVLQGKVRAKVNQKYDGSPDNSFRVKTPTAVAGVRGTDFITGFNPTTRRSEILTFHGAVTAQAVLPGGGLSQPVTVAAGQMLNNIAPGTPLEVKPASPEQIAGADQASDADKIKSEAPERQPADQRPAEDKPKENPPANTTDSTPTDTKPSDASERRGPAEQSPAADTTGAAKEPASGRPSQPNAKPEDAGRERGGNAGTADRPPAGASAPGRSATEGMPKPGPNPAAGPMLKPVDLPTAPTGMIPPPLGTPGLNVGFMPPTNSQPTFVPPRTDVIQDNIQKGSSQVLIRVINN